MKKIKLLNRISAKFILVFALLFISLLGSIFSALYVTDVQKQHIVLTEGLYEMRLMVEEVTQASEYYVELQIYNETALENKQDEIKELKNSIKQVKEMYADLYNLKFYLEDGQVLDLEFNGDFGDQFVAAVQEADESWEMVEENVELLSMTEMLTTDELMVTMKKNKTVNEIVIENNNELMRVCREAAENSKKVSDMIQVGSLFLGIGILLFVLIYMFKGVYRPVIYIRDKFKKMSKGDLSQRFDRKENDEFTLLYDDFNVFLNALDSIFDIENKVVQEPSLENILLLLNERLKEFISYDSIGVVYRNYQGSCSEIIVSSGEVRTDICTTHQQIYDEMVIDGERLIIPVKLQGTMLGYYYFTNIKDSITEKQFISLIRDKLNIAFYKNVLVKELLSIITETLSETAEAKDPETYNHLIRMSSYSQIIAKEMKKSDKNKCVINGEFIENIKITAPMHDIGKISIKDEILLKPGRLTEEEFDIMKTHTSNGGKILRNLNEKMKYYGISYFDMASVIAYEHQEKYDGNGYPTGLAGNKISLEARIVAVADVFDALTSKRPYKEAFSLEKSYQIIRDSKGTHFDPEIVEAFFRAQDEIESVYHTYKEV